MNDPDTILREIARGDQEAFRFCVDFYNFLHLLDDLYDRDVVVTPQELGEITIRAIKTFSGNSFYHRHLETLLPSIQNAIVSWVDSEEWQRHSDPREQVAAQVMKSQYHEVFYTVAGLVGGLSHQLGMTRRYREYDWT